ncbi:MAG: tRNA pseudouridine(38-40) synthase TruA [Candidatus Cybelea sp.]
MEYDGSQFCGFQWQPVDRTVAGVLEKALSHLFGEPVKVTAAGRTDSGVHATGQVVSVATDAPFPFERLAFALNAVLPADCSVREAAVVDSGFSARFSALERTYVYAIAPRPQRGALTARYAWHVPQRLDVNAMRTAAAQVVGEHDFRSFCSVLPVGADDEPLSTVRSLYRFTIEPRSGLLRLEVAGSGFLHRMARSLVGTLVEVGSGRRSGDLAGVLASADRSAAGGIAPARGLYLAGVRYDDGYDSFAEPPILRRDA